MINTVIPGESVNDIIVTDNCKNSDEIVKNIDKHRLFRKVYHLEIKDEYYRGNLIKKIRKSLKLFNSSQKTKRQLGIESWEYDALFFTDFSLLVNQIFFHIKKENPQCKIYRVEEGYSTYTIFNSNVTMQNVATVYGRLSRKKTIYDSIDGLYLYDPSLVQYSTAYPLYVIPPINAGSSDFVKTINMIFGIQKTINITDRKYIFFEESFSVDKAEREEFNDLQLIDQVIKCVGEQDICIKTHPRTFSTERYDRYKGIEMMNASVPWELMYLNCNLSDKILITISSGSVINALPWTKQTAKVILMFKCIYPRPRLCTPEYVNYLSLLTEKYGGGNFVIPSNIEEFIALFQNDIL